MGSASSQFQEAFTQMMSEDSVHSLLSEEIRDLTYEKFLSLLGELNLLAKECLDSNGHQLVFAVKKDSDSTIFWKATVQIACVKIIPETQKVSTFRLLSLHEFIKVFQTLKCQINAIQQCESRNESSKSNISPDFTISTLFDSKFDVQPNECCICFERKQDVILPCAHSYCVTCIEQWTKSNDSCPICREKLDSTDDTWVMSEMPKAEEISNSIKENLMELTNEKAHSCNPS